MDYTNDILTRLQRGEDVNAIATELTKSINDANTRYKAEVEAKRKAEQEAKLKAAAEEAARNDKVKACESLLDALYEVCVAWDFDGDIIDEIEHYDAAEFASQLDDIIPAIQKWTELVGMLRADDELISPVRKAPVGDSLQRKSTSPIDEFLNKYVR